MNASLVEIAWQDPVALFETLCDEPYALFFDSADNAHPMGRVSYILWNPSEIYKASDGNPFRALKAKQTSNLTQHYFCGGWAGYFGYEVAHSLENIGKRKPCATPDTIMAYYEHGLIFDHEKQKAFVFFPEGQEQPKIPLAKTNHAREQTISFQSTLSQAQFERDVQTVIDYIYAGDIFQANLARKLVAKRPADFDAWAQYKRLRQISPAPFAAFMQFGDFQILSSSPESFLSARNGHVTTSPIKGTVPRYKNDPEADKQSIERLLTSEKDRAENIMIVDLLRNDLAKVCEDASIQEPKLCALESFSHVHHLVSTVTGTLRPDKTVFDLLEGAFPGGSITGAPKIRAMQIINELEPFARGPYCGSLALIGDDGYLESNIAIRTLTATKDGISFHVGGGITALSDPKEEYLETAAKAEGILKSFS